MTTPQPAPATAPKATTSSDTLLDRAPTIASYALQDPAHPEIELAQVRHRIRLIDAWGHTVIAPGSRVLELGCGQGTATTVLAEAVGPEGHVDAVDPGDPDYGAPFTLAQAQEHISSGPLGSRITWHRATPEQFLDASSGSNDDETKTWDVAVLCHCIWYFESVRVLEDTLRSLGGRVKHLCIAEYALHATEPDATPHVLAVLARAMLESYKSMGGIASSENVKTPASPAVIKEVAGRAGWVLAAPRGGEDGEDAVVVVPEKGLSDGQWEAGTVVGHGFETEVDAAVVDDRARLVVWTARDAAVAAVEGIGGGGGIKGVRTMDVWAAVFEE